MRYIGGKTDLLPVIEEVLGRRHITSIIDIFSGSGAVSMHFARKGMQVYGNDILFFSYILNKAAIQIARKPKYKNLSIKDPIGYLNKLSFDLAEIDRNDCFIWKNYSPHQNCTRQYFQEKNALKIDIIRITIERWYRLKKITKDEYIYLLSRLIAAVPFVSNIAGVYGAYLKFWDKRSYKDLELKDAEFFVGLHSGNCVYNQDYKDILPSIQADLLYADPPYNTRQYLPNYHILETIARYDYPEIYGVSGMRKYGESEKSDFCSRAKVEQAFDSLIRQADVSTIIISYNNEGLVSTEKLCDICSAYARQGSFDLYQTPYGRYRNKEGQEKQVYEQLYVFDKR